jgi:hypothetical protein
VSCGSQLGFTLTVNATNAVTKIAKTSTFHFIVQTGRPGGTPTHIAYAGAPVPIPDDNPVGASALLTVGGIAGPVAKVVFNIDGATCSAAIGSTTVGIDHTWVGDLTATLKSPSGTTTTLFDAAGGAGNSGNNFCKTVLSDDGATSIQNVTVGQAPFTGTFKPLQSNSVFAGQDPTGTWTFHVTDNAFLDSGSIRAFSLDVTGFTCN